MWLKRLLSNLNGRHEVVAYCLLNKRSAVSVCRFYHMPSRHQGGRPPKYNEPSRPVTVTLPESTLSQLAGIDPDRGRAIVKLAQYVTESHPPSTCVELTQVPGSGAIILVGRCPALDRIPFLHLIEVAPGRHLLALGRDHDFSTLELAVQDLLDEESNLTQDDAQILQSLRTMIRQLRRANRVSHAEILLVDVEEAR